MPTFSRIAAILAAVGSTQALQWLGRVNPATRELTWPATGVSFTFIGDSATVNVKTYWGSNSFDLSIDGAEPTLIPEFSGTNISTPAGLKYGNHTVVLQKRSEAGYGTVTLGDVVVHGRLGRDVLPKRRVEIIGDSISVGYGLDGVLPCVNSAALEDGPKTYGALAAKAVGAAYSIIAVSGKGIIRNYPTGDVDTSPLMSEYYTRYGTNDADNSYTYPAATAPDAVVINLGTNDWNYIAYNSSGPYNARPQINVTEYTDALLTFIHGIESHYPKAQFFLVGSPMINDYYPTTEEKAKTTQSAALQSVATQLGAKGHFVDWPSQGSDVGCDYHPNAATHAQGGALLTAALKDVLNW